MTGHADHSLVRLFIILDELSLIKAKTFGEQCFWAGSICGLCDAMDTIGEGCRYDKYRKAAISLLKDMAEKVLPQK